MSGTWALAVTYIDEANDMFLTLGCATWKAKRERDRNLRGIPAANKETDYLLDIESPRGIEDDRYLDAATVESLLGKPIAVLVAEARAAELRAQKGGS